MNQRHSNDSVINLRERERERERGSERGRERGREREREREREGERCGGESRHIEIKDKRDRKEIWTTVEGMKFVNIVCVDCTVLHFNYLVNMRLILAKFFVKHKPLGLSG